MKTVLVSGSFNVLHPGHLRLFRFAKECGDRLIVAVYSDKLAAVAAHVHEHLRLEGVRSISWVDDAFIIHDSIIDTIKSIQPDVVVKGKEHESRFNPELVAIEEYGGRLLFSSGETVFSSLDLIRKEFNHLAQHSISLPEEYLKRHNILPSKLNNLLHKFSHLNVCVVGDLIIDEYITCQPLGMSQEDPTIVVTPVDVIRFIGGAGIVAAHAAGLGAKVKFISVTGKDAVRDYAHEKLIEMGVNSRLIIDDNRPTTLKQRYRCNGKSMLRVSYLHQGTISMPLQKQMLYEIVQAIEGADLLVFSDFNYGCLPQPLVEQIILIAKKRGVMLAADSQSSSQIGDIGRFKGMNLITPTEREARLSTRNNEDGLVVLAEQLKQQSSADNILLKLGEEGLLIHAGISNKTNWLTDRVDALNTSPKDVAGAGDSLLIASALTLASGGSIWDAAAIGSVAAAVQIGRLGNIPLKTNEILAEIGKILTY